MSLIHSLNAGIQSSTPTSIHPHASVANEQGPAPPSTLAYVSPRWRAGPTHASVANEQPSAQSGTLAHPSAPLASIPPRWRAAFGRLPTLACRRRRAPHRWRGSDCSRAWGNACQRGATPPTMYVFTHLPPPFAPLASRRRRASARWRGTLGPMRYLRSNPGRRPMGQNRRGTSEANPFPGTSRICGANERNPGVRAPLAT